MRKYMLLINTVSISHILAVIIIAQFSWLTTQDLFLYFAGVMVGFALSHLGTKVEGTAPLWDMLVPMVRTGAEKS